MSSKIYESLKLFYLGKEENGEPILYENKDLNTHALIIGMTGSGKTGLGVGLIEEATIDNISSIIIDPKGDMGNLLLAFPDLSAQEFEPWIDENEARSKNLDVKTVAQNTASFWEKGINDWDMDKSRVKQLAQSADFTIYTPGASIGVSVSILSSFKAPPKEVLEDSDFFNALISSTVTGILGFVGINADPLSSKEHILLSSIFTNEYKNGKDLSIEDIINFIVKPPFEKVGVFPLERFMSQDVRLEFAMKLNAIIASPSFAAWCEGESLDIAKLLMSKDGKPRVCIFSIAHLSDSERMFFVTLLLNNIISWMRQQEGTSSLRALVYMDEIFGFFPPNANPSSKVPMLTLLKQARAFGLGVVLSTQNPVDLDYKGLSNIGTWFVGRLQTTQDKERVIDGLSGIQGSQFSKSELMSLISNLEKRKFLLKNIHENGLKVFQTRWTLSYLKGPLSREQIRTLTEHKRVKKEDIKEVQVIAKTKPLISANIEELYFYEKRATKPLLVPTLTYFSKVRFVNASKGINKEENFSIYSFVDERQNSTNWERDQINKSRFTEQPLNESSFENVANFINEPRMIAELEKKALDFVYRNAKLTIFSEQTLKMKSLVDESIESFRLRVKTKLDELFNEESKKIKDNFEKAQKVLEVKLARAQAKLDKEKHDVQSKTIDIVTSVGSSILGVLFGRNMRSASSISKTVSGVKNTSKVLKEREDVKAAQDEVQRVYNDMEELRSKLQDDAKILSDRYSSSNVLISEEYISPRKSDIFDTKIALVWREI